MNSTELSFQKSVLTDDHAFGYQSSSLEQLLPNAGASAWESEDMLFGGNPVSAAAECGALVPFYCNLDDFVPVYQGQNINQVTVPCLEFKDFDDVWNEFGLQASGVNQVFFEESKAVVVTEPRINVTGETEFDRHKYVNGQFGVLANETNKSFFKDEAVHIVDAKPLMMAEGGPRIDHHYASAMKVESSSNWSLAEYSEDNFSSGRRITSSGLLQFDDIRQYFEVPITKAAKELKVGLTVLKKRCRELNIMRWPHRKIKSLKSLIQNAKELGFTDEVAMLEEHKRMLRRIPEMELTDRTKKLRQACFKANYKKRRALAIMPASQS